MQFVDAISFEPQMVLLIVLCGFAIGVLSGMFGIGGGTLIVPLYNLAFGLPMIAATATSLFTIVPTALSGALRHLRQKTIHFKVGIIIGLTGACFSVIGSLIAGSVPELVLVLITVAVILYSAITMILKAREKSFTPTTGTEQAAQKASDLRKRSALFIVLGAIAGLTAGLVGIGGGFIIVPFCVAVLGFSLKEAAGTSLLAISIIAIPGIIAHGMLGQIAWLYGLALIVGTIPGAQLGAWLAAKLPERPLRAAFGILLCVSAVLLLVKNISA
ncbi:MAG: sulfite exporter TauE/SafE family protein [Coriobacteriia bacterium]|nr:sulfite exporter TauE/SafE family protein [Coriobacteriia bacterium]